MIFNRKYKDSVFTDLFGSDKNGKKNFLDLYNALTGTNYKIEEVKLERKIIEQSLYKTFNNDVSWEINGKLIVLVEHQSTVNENMPFRCLEYVTRIYEGIVPPKMRYAEKMFKLPNPDFFVVYVGKKELPKEQELRLSDAFYQKDNSKLELVVKLVNCSDSQTLPLCRTCDILVDYLDRKSREVINMLSAKYNYKMDIAVKKEEAFQDGVEHKAIETAKKMLADNLDPEKIALYSGLPLEKVLELQKQILVNV
jgi:predicted transposase YdaD